jgi:TatD DNase family protein
MRAIVDCHAHIGDAVFDPDRAAVLARAAAAGVAAVVAVGETLADAERNLALAAEHPAILPAAGLYPTHLDLDQASEVETFVRRHRERLVAIGEVGLDHWKVKEPHEREVQREIFLRFVRLADELALPLNVHSRSAAREAIALLLDAGARRVQLHAFDGRAATALPAVEGGFFFSVPPSIVRSRQKQKLVRRLPLDCLLLETDSPVLGPEPEGRNEPANARVSLRAVAEIKDVSEEEVAEAAARNATRLFGRDLTAASAP